MPNKMVSGQSVCFQWLWPLVTFSHRTALAWPPWVDCASPKQVPAVLGRMQERSPRSGGHRLSRHDSACNVSAGTAVKGLPGILGLPPMSEQYVASSPSRGRVMSRHPLHSHPCVSSGHPFLHPESLHLGAIQVHGGWPPPKKMRGFFSFWRPAAESAQCDRLPLRLWLDWLATKRKRQGRPTHQRGTFWEPVP